MPTPEELARENIDPLLEKCGWKVQTRLSRSHRHRTHNSAGTIRRTRPPTLLHVARRKARRRNQLQFRSTRLAGKNARLHQRQRQRRPRTSRSRQRARADLQSLRRASLAVDGGTQPNFGCVKKTARKKAICQTVSGEYGGLIGGIAELLEASRRSAARAVNALMTATYWEIGRRIVEFEQ